MPHEPENRIPSGVSFPDNPEPGAKFIRTDRDVTYDWKQGRWVAVIATKFFDEEQANETQ